jgi:uncharacterized protein YprB with RNaseH-like and TPR domain
MIARMEWPERDSSGASASGRCSFLDLETCGLTACPVFLAGVALIGESDLVLRQIFARDYLEEARSSTRWPGSSASPTSSSPSTGSHSTCRSSVIARHTTGWRSRRSFRTSIFSGSRAADEQTLPDCKLKTLEWRVLRRRRSGDVGGSDIPGLYHDFVQRGVAHRLVPVFHHNMLDVVAMVELLPALFDPDAVVY